MNLARIQLLSLVTKGVTTALGIIQSVIIVRILSPAEFGLVGLVMSIGSVIGVSQHLGVVDGAIREIAVRNKKKDIAHILWASHAVRQIVTIPLSLILFGVAPYIAGRYGYPEITPYIRVFAAALILQGLQDVWGATLTGMKRFVSLYIIQIITALINIAVFGLLTWKYGVSGFFWAVIVTTGIMVTLLALDAVRSLRGSLALPTLQDFRRVARQIVRIGAYTYLSRIFFVVWQRLPILMLGAALSTDELGFVNASLTFGARITIIAAALSEVNLSWMSSLFVKKPAEFAAQVTRNMHRVLILMLALTLVLLFFTPEILRFVIGAEYLPAHPIILLMTTAFFLYALTDIATSSIFIPSDNPRLRAIVYGVLVACSGGILTWVLLMHPSSMFAAWAMVAGAVIAYIGTVILARVRFKVQLLTPQLAVLLILLAGSVWFLLSYPSLLWRIGLFTIFLAYTLWEAHQQKLIPRLATLLQREPSPAVALSETDVRIICFAGAFYDVPNWTNRQHIMTKFAKSYPVLYVEPRVWIFRYVLQNLTRPGRVLRYLQKLLFWQRHSGGVIIVAQWNLFPGSRESQFISKLNHLLNRYCLLIKARLLGFTSSIIWIYDTEAAEYLSAFKENIVFYDCVDDHASQAGVDRNSKRVEEEEKTILTRADVVTVTSQRLYELKKKKNPNVHLVLNAGDVDIYDQPKPAPAALRESLQKISSRGPILGSVGALDSYKVDFQLLQKVAKQNPSWQFVFIGRPVVDKARAIPKALKRLLNVHFLGEVPRENVPDLVSFFTICLITYKHNRYNQASFPLKFWEFMASGKPIIVSGLPELKKFSPDISYCKDAAQIEEAVHRYLQSDPQSGARVQEAKKHTWSHRAATLQNLLLKELS